MLVEDPGSSGVVWGLGGKTPRLPDYLVISKTISILAIRLFQGLHLRKAPLWSLLVQTFVINLGYPDGVAFRESQLGQGLGKRLQPSLILQISAVNQ